MGFAPREEQEFPPNLPRVRAHAPALGDHPPQVLVLGLDAEQERRFQPHRRPDLGAKLSPWSSNPASCGSSAPRPRTMFHYTDTKQSPWWVVEADDKRRARLNRISHLLEQIPYGDLTPEPIDPPASPTAAMSGRPDRPDLVPTATPERAVHGPIAVGADDAGAPLKERLAAYLQQRLRGQGLRQRRRRRLPRRGRRGRPGRRPGRARPGLLAAAPAWAWPSPPTRSPSRPPPPTTPTCRTGPQVQQRPGPHHGRPRHRPRSRRRSDPGLAHRRVRTRPLLPQGRQSWRPWTSVTGRPGPEPSGGRRRCRRRASQEAVTMSSETPTVVHSASGSAEVTRTRVTARVPARPSRMRTLKSTRLTSLSSGWRGSGRGAGPGRGRGPGRRPRRRPGPARRRRAGARWPRRRRCPLSARPGPGSPPG